MRKLCLVGQPEWSDWLADLINRYSEGRIRARVLSPERPGDWIRVHRLLTADILLRLGYRPGSPSRRGVALDTAWSLLRRLKPNARTGYYWIGTDVLDALHDAAAGRTVRRFWGPALAEFHLTGAPWLAAELAGVGVRAAPALFPGGPPPAAVPPLPRTFAVLTYIPDQRYRFYGGDCIYAAARELAAIPFHVVYGQGHWVPAPLPNLHFHGEQRDMQPWYAGASAVVRMVAHDGIGLTVREGLAYGRHVIYSYGLPFTRRVPFGDAGALAGAIGELHTLHEAGRLPLNLAGRAFALRTFDPARNTRALTEHLLGGIPCSPGC